MTFKSKLSSVIDKLTPGHKSRRASAVTSENESARITETTTQAHTGATTSSNVADTRLAEANPAAFTYGENPATAAAVGGGVAAGVTGEHTTATGDVCMAGDGKAPVPTGERYFVVVEDHVVIKERVERWEEHQPIEREYVTRVEETGVVTTSPVYREGAIGPDRIVHESTCYPTEATTITGVAGVPVDSKHIV